MSRRRRRPRRNPELRLWATKMADPELHRDSTVMVEALQHLAGQLPSPGPDPSPQQQFIGHLRELESRCIVPPESDHP